MARYIASRLLQGLVTLLVLSVVVFILARVAGDPLALLLPTGATEEDVTQMRQELGFDKPQHVQYWYFIKDAVKGDFGNSLKSRAPVVDLIRARLPVSFRLALASIIITVLVSFPLGVLAAVRKGSIIDTLARGLAVLGVSLPSFWVGILVIQIFAVSLKIMPTGELNWPLGYILPSLTLGWHVVAGMTRLLRSSMLEVLDSEYIKLARIKGVPEVTIIWKHALRNALIPVTTFGGMYLAILIAMAIAVEVVFTIPGIGRLAYESIMFRDYPVIQGVVLTMIGIVIVLNLAVDIIIAIADPRLRVKARVSG